MQGAAKRWLYLYINSGKAELMEASHLLGKDTYEMVDEITKELGKRERQVSVVSIGPAGENKTSDMFPKFIVPGWKETAKKCSSALSPGSF